MGLFFFGVWEYRIELVVFQIRWVIRRLVYWTMVGMVVRSEGDQDFEGMIRRFKNLEFLGCCFEADKE